jgi:hypothetical protein
VIILSGLPSVENVLPYIECDHVGAGLVDLAVDGECGTVEGAVTFDDFAFVVHADEVTDGHQLEVGAEWVHPEAVKVLGVAHGDVPGDPFGQVEAAHRAQARSEALLAMEALGREVDLRGGRFLLEFCELFIDGVRHDRLPLFVECDEFNVVARRCGRSGRVGTNDDLDSFDLVSFLHGDTHEDERDPEDVETRWLLVKHQPPEQGADHRK